MENSIYVGLSRAVALQRDMDTVSNNIANMNTPGFRGQYMLFEEFIEKPKGIEDPLSMVLDYGQYMSNRPGTMKMTNNPLDAAIQGTGFFSVQRGDDIFYTRAGNFQRNVDGQLVTTDGDAVLSAGGAPIIIPEDSIEVRIAENGTISNQGGEIGQLAVTEFDNINTLEAVGDGMYRARENANGVAAIDSRVIQGVLEGSNVNAISEMTRMIDVHRAYQSIHKMLHTEHERQRSMIQRLTRSG
jgi:flagellar basal-body rod protein FlgF